MPGTLDNLADIGDYQYTRATNERMHCTLKILADIGD